MIFVYVIIGIIAAFVLFSFMLKLFLHFPLRKKEPGFEYVHVDEDGTVRELYKDEIEYLKDELHPNDSSRPYIKASYKQLTPDNKIWGFIRRRRVPKNIVIRRI